MNTEPLSRIADGELQERMLRFGDLAMAADSRHDQAQEPEHARQARRRWEALCALTQEMLRRSRVSRPSANDSGKGRA